jgi:D-alanyl-D-alanine carboxypeptidase
MRSASIFLGRPSRAAALLVLAGALMLPVRSAEAGPTLLLEGSTGQVLYAEEPDQSWFPASLTKMMTAYVVFDAIKAGKVRLDTPVPLSEKARGQPATRIGLKAGIPLNVEQALRGLILRSANDFAMALAELVGESEEGFAELMNSAARRIGMTRSHFKNPHGLPDPEQHTTARDMGILAMAILRDFPERAEIFSTTSFVIHKGTFHSQNDLLRTLPGADGMKTGFTCGAGYNVVATATREGRRLIAVVLGEHHREERSARASALLEHGFATVEWKLVLGAPRLASIQIAPPASDTVHDMTKETRARQCGFRGRVARRALIAKGAPRPAARATAPVATGSLP